MSESINMKLSLDENCNLIATYIQDEDLNALSQILEPCEEFTSTIDFTNRAIVEFITDYDGNIDYSSYRVHEIKSNNDPEIYESEPIELPKDGNFTYYRIVLPTFSLIKNNNKNKYFVFTKNGKSAVYRADINITNSINILDSYEVLNPLSIWENRNESIQNMYYFSHNIYSLCKLNKCLLAMEKNMFNKNGCDFACRNEESTKRDFLLTTIHILEYLGNNEQYDDAQSIINTVMSCGGLCESTFNRNGGCGCGKTV